MQTRRTPKIYPHATVERLKKAYEGSREHHRILWSPRFQLVPRFPSPTLGGGLKLIVLSAVLYGPGTVHYFWARREQNKPVRQTFRWIIFVLAIVDASVGISWLATGYIPFKLQI